MKWLAWVCAAAALAAACADGSGNSGQSSAAPSSAGPTGGGGLGAGGQAPNATGPGAGGVMVGGQGGANGGAGGMGVGGALVGGGQAGGGGGAPCGNEVDAAACYACCAGVYAIGDQILRAQFGVCGCSPTSCYPDCIPFECGNSGAPDNTCVACIEQAVDAAGDCGMDATFQANCLNVADCANLLACVSNCTP